MAADHRAGERRGDQLGVEVVDVRIRRADLPSPISQAVFERMRTERQQEAAQVRAEGEEIGTQRSARPRTAT